MSKYRVDTTEAGKAARTYRGRLYASKAECRYAVELDARMGPGGDVAWWIRQVGFDLGEDTRYHADFVVFAQLDKGGIYAVDVKGVETASFRRIRRLWAKYGPIPLHIVRRGQTAEVL